MRLSVRQYAQALVEIGRDADAQVSQEIGRRFGTWLSRRRETRIFRNIVAEAERMLKAQSGIVDVTITTAHPADAPTQTKLKSEAGKIFGGKKTAVRFLVDQRLIGGANIRSDETLYDASLATATRELKKNLES